MRAILASALLAITAAPLAAQHGVGIDYERFALPNGLTVILHRDTTTPTIATNIWYHVGSGHEMPGRTGFAHLFEHIMFEGSANVPEGKIDEWFEEIGGSPNGSTSRDRTNYFQSFASSALDLALFIESDRMGLLLPAMSPATVDGQRDVVKNERRQSYDNRPYGLASQILAEELYPSTHPYSWPVIGYMDHLGAASYQDVVDFFETHYAPNNASIAIVGDFDTAEARWAVEKWFADIPPGEPVERLEASPPAISGTRRLALEDRVQLPRLYMRWLSPAAYQEDDAALIALARLLADGKNSRLYARLVYELQIADDVFARQTGARLGGEFEIVTTARGGNGLGELERVVLEEIERIKAEPPQPRELERIVNQYEAGFLERLELVSAKAEQLNAYLFYTGTPDYFEEDLERFRRLRPADLSSAAARVLDPDARVVLSIVPRDAIELAVPGSRLVSNHQLELNPDARTEGLAGAEPEGPEPPGAGATDRAAPPALGRAPDRSAPPAVGEAPDVALPVRHEFTLANGLRVVLMEKRELPLVQLNLLLDAGTVRDEADRPGLASLTAAMLDEGAGGRSALEIADAFEHLGARFNAGAGTHSASLSLRVPTPRLEDALELAADVLLRPDFPPEELERLRLERLTALVRRHDVPGAIAGVLVDETLFGPDHPYGRPAIGREGSLRAVTVDDLRAFHEAYYRPGGASVIVVGDIDAASARLLLEEAFGSWRGAGVEPALVPHAAQVRGRVVHLVDKPGAAQSVVRLGRIGVQRTSEDYYALEVMNTILGGSFTSRLNQNLREDKGYTYGARSSFGYLPGAGPWIASADVQTHSTGPAIAEFMNELRAIRQPIPSEEVERAKNFLAMRYPAGFQSVAGIAARLGELVEHGLPLDYFEDYVDRVLEVTVADVERVAREYIDPENVTLFVVGDREVIEQQIRDLELGEVRLLTVTEVLGEVPVVAP